MTNEKASLIKEIYSLTERVDQFDKPKKGKQLGSGRVTGLLLLQEALEWISSDLERQLSGYEFFRMCKSPSCHLNLLSISGRNGWPKQHKQNIKRLIWWLHEAGVKIIIGDWNDGDARNLKSLQLKIYRHICPNLPSYRYFYRNQHSTVDFAIIKQEFELTMKDQITPANSNDIYHTIITWKYAKSVQRIYIKPTLLNTYRFNVEIASYLDANKRNNNKMISGINTFIIYSAALIDDRELMKVMNSSYWKAKHLQLKEKQRKLIKETKSYSKQWGVYHSQQNQERENAFNSIKDKHIQIAWSSISLPFIRRSLLYKLSTSTEDFELNIQDLTYAWPRLSKLSTSGDSPSAACLKLIQFENKIKLSQFLIKRGTNELAEGKMIFIPKGKKKSISCAKDLRAITLSNQLINIYERALAKRLYSWYERAGFLSDWLFTEDQKDHLHGLLFSVY
ncbi:hypothetical protein GJ496_003292 [Pomphorhynchus laevis]|nr:hypothetical protein GJ496_003292 [Pomphorhynchus laevis]